jgi:hypothetical protein
MAEFSISGLDDLVIKIDDDALGDAVEYHIRNEVETQFGDLDLADTVSDEIWSFRQWDEIISKEIGRGILEAEGYLTKDDVEGKIEDLLRDFLHVTAENRCGVGEAFAQGVKRVIGEIFQSIEDQPNAFKANFEPMIREVVQSEIHQSMGKLMDEMIEIKKVTDSVEVHENNTEFQQELEQTIGRITKQHIKMAGRQSLFTLDRIWPPTGQTSGMALRGMEKVEEESEATRD